MGRSSPSAPVAGGQLSLPSPPGVEYVPAIVQELGNAGWPVAFEIAAGVLWIPEDDVGDGSVVCISGGAVEQLGGGAFSEARGGGDRAD